MRAIPSTQWRITSHDATQYGTRLLDSSFLPGRDFPYPKSLYAVEDALRFFVIDNPEAAEVPDNLKVSTLPPDPPKKDID